jgi:hypothetical protein
MQHLAYSLYNQKIWMGILTIFINNKKSSSLLSTKHGFFKTIERILNNYEKTAKINRQMKK